MFIKKLSIKMKISLAAIIILLLLAAVLSLYSITQSNNMLESEERKALLRVGDYIQSQMDNQLTSARMSVLGIARNPEIQRLFAERNREELKNRLLPVYDEISEEVAQFQFHEPDSTSFLRLHKPDNYGDDLSDFRQTVNQANKEQEIVMGLEEGRGGFGFRVVAPVFHNDEHIGSVEYGSSFDNSFVNEIKEKMSGDYFIYVFEDMASVSWDELEGGSLGATTEDEWQVEEEYISQLKNGEKIFTLSENNKYRILLQPFEDFQGEVSGYIKTVQNREEITDQNAATVRNIILIALLGTFLSALFIYFLIKWQLKPLQTFRDLFSDLALGDLTVRFPIEKINCSEIMDCGEKECPDFAKDGVTCWFDVGSFAPEFDKEIYCPKITSGEYDSCEECICYKKVNSDEIQTLGAWFNKLADSFQEVVGKVSSVTSDLSASSQEMSASSQEMSASAEEIGAAIQQVASGAQEQSAQIDETTENVNDLANQIENVENMSKEMDEQSDSVMDNIEDGNEAIDFSIKQVSEVKTQTQEVAESINRLGELSQEIGNIVDLINGISEQTNLLALNAAIEAARAGESGRGFSVVADEIRELAEESSEATEQISDLITEIQEDVKDSVKQMHQTEETVNESVDAIQKTDKSFDSINQAAEKLSQLIENIAQRAQQMEKNSEEVRTAIAEIASVSEEASGNAEEVAASSQQQASSTQEIVNASEELARMAEELSNTVKHFKI